MDPRISVVLLCVLVIASSSRACNETARQYGSVQDSRLCYECNGLGNYCLKRLAMCPVGFSKCMNSAIVMEIGGTTLTIKKRECIDDCQSGSMNFGISKTAFSCCESDFCNARDAPDPRTIRPNGRTCYYCDGESCSKTVSCSGSEDACITATLTNRGSPVLVKGCITKSICGLLKCSFIRDLSCCEGNLCNRDKGVPPGVVYSGDKRLGQSVTQSFMHKGAKSITRRIPNNNAKSITRRIPNNGPKSDTRRIPNNCAKSDTQSFLFLCCSLLSYFLLH